MAIAMVAMLAFGGTYAYFSATANGVSAKAETGAIKLSTAVTETIVMKQNMLPGESTSATVEYTDGSTRASYVFFKLGECKWTTALAADSDIEATITGITLNGTKLETRLDDGTYYYANGVDENGAVKTAPTSKLTVVVSISLNGNATSVNGAEDSDKAMNNSFTVSIEASAIQQEGYASAQEAYDAMA